MVTLVREPSNYGWKGATDGPPHYNLAVSSSLAEEIFKDNQINFTDGTEKDSVNVGTLSTELEKKLTIAEKEINFVINCPIYVPTPDSDNESDSSDESITTYNEEDFINPPFYIKKETLGRVSVDCIVAQYNKKAKSSLIKPFLSKLESGGLEDTDKIYEEHIAAVIGLNRPKSLSKKKNSYLQKELSSFLQGKFHKFFGFFWEHQWIDKKSKKSVSYEKVYFFYRQFKRFKLEEAKKFRKDQEKNSLIPYQGIREKIKNHEHVAFLVKNFREGYPSSVIYLSIIDGDTANFNRIFSAYIRHIDVQNPPDLISTGYEFSEEQKGYDEHHRNIIPALKFGSKLDRIVRAVTANICPLGIYYPEPNFCILILDDKTSIEESFIDKSYKDGKMESVALIRKLKDRKDFEAKFIYDNPIITAIPKRAFYNPSTINKKIPKLLKFSKAFCEGKYYKGTNEDFKNLALISQSHFSGRCWATNIRVNKGEFEVHGVGSSGYVRGSLTNLLNIYKSHFLEETSIDLDDVDILDIKKKLKEKAKLSDSNIELAEYTAKSAAIAAYMFIWNPKLDVNKLLDLFYVGNPKLIYILLNFIYETEFSIEELREFYDANKSAFDMYLLYEDAVIFICKYFGLGILIDEEINQEIVDQLGKHICDLKFYLENEDSDFEDEQYAAEDHANEILLHLIRNANSRTSDNFVDDAINKIVFYQNRYYMDFEEISSEIAYQNEQEEGYDLRSEVYSEDQDEYDYSLYDYHIHKITYQNKLLNSYDGQMLFEMAARNKNIDAINLFLELGKDEFIAEQILLAIEKFSAKKVLEVFFSDKVKDLQIEEITNIDPESTQHKTQDEQILEAIAQIELIIGREFLEEITGWHQYISTALSNKPLFSSAMKVIQIMDNLVNNLGEWLDFGNLYESTNIKNQVTIILTQLEHWIDFVASGITHVGLPPRHPDFNPDDYYGGGFGNGIYGNYSSSDENTSNENQLIASLSYNGSNYNITQYYDVY